MVATGVIRTAVGILGNVISLALFLSPLPTFVTIVKKRDVEQYSPLPYLWTLLNCLFWVVYGLPLVKPGSTLVLTINGAGLAIEMSFIVVFVMFSPGKKRLVVVLAAAVECAAAVVVGVLVITLVDEKSQRATIVGTICIVFCIMMYVAPLGVMKMVIKTKSVEYMPFCLSLASLGNGACWTVYALLKFDINLLVPNGIGLAFAVAQIILYAAYYKSTQRMLADRKTGEVSLANVVVHGGVGNAVGNRHAR